MKNHFEWKGTGGKRGQRDGGYIHIEFDQNNLPILCIEVDDDFYSGQIDHKTLFHMITELAEMCIEKKKEKIQNEQR